MAPSLTNTQEVLMSKSLCSVGGCDRQIKARGLCSKHYQKWQRYRNNPWPTAESRFWSMVNKTDTCWVWTGGLSRGYGKFFGKGAHRYAYEALVGPIPEGLQLDHLCRNPPCVNPAHLEPVTPRVNTLRGVGPQALNARKTHCKRGHEFTAENTYKNQGQRICRQCSRDKARRWWRSRHPGYQPRV